MDDCAKTERHETALNLIQHTLENTANLLDDGINILDGTKARILGATPSSEEAGISKDFPFDGQSRELWELALNLNRKAEYITRVAVSLALI